MNNNDNNPVEIKITQDKLVDLLLHAATREDIAKLAADNKMDIDKLATDTKADNAKLAADIDKLATDTKADNAKLAADIDKLAADNKANNAAMLKALESFEARNDRQFQKIDNRYNWIISIIAASVLTLGSMIAKGFHWF